MMRLKRKLFVVPVQLRVDSNFDDSLVYYTVSEKSVLFLKIVPIIIILILVKEYCHVYLHFFWF